MSKTVLFQISQFSISTQFQCEKILFQIIQFSISTQFSSIGPIDRTLSGTTTSGQSGSGSNGNEGVLRIPQGSNITGTSPLQILVSYPGHSLWEVVLPICRYAVNVFYNPNRLVRALTLDVMRMGLDSKFYGTKVWKTSLYYYSPIHVGKIDQSLFQTVVVKSETQKPISEARTWCTVTYQIDDCDITRYK